MRTMGPRVLVSVVCLLAYGPTADAKTFTWSDGVCTDDLMFFNECLRWDGPDGFSVVSDMPEWTFDGDRFDHEFMLESEDRQTHIVFRRNQRFSLESLSMQLGGFADDFDGCAQPMEVRSSRGGYLLIEPDAGVPGEMCWQYTDTGFELAPYPWAVTHGKLVTFDGPEWSGINWFYVGFTPAWNTRPHPRYSTFMLHEVQYIPEPSSILLVAMGLTGLACRARRAGRRPLG